MTRGPEGWASPQWGRRQGSDPRPTRPPESRGSEAPAHVSYPRLPSVRPPPTPPSVARAPQRVRRRPVLVQFVVVELLVVGVLGVGVAGWATGTLLLGESSGVLGRRGMGSSLAASPGTGDGNGQGKWGRRSLSGRATDRRQE